MSPSAYALASSRALQRTNSRMSGWSPSRITIFAARRVPPPDLMEPAPESAQRMKLTGPEAWPPLESASPSLRSRERLTPAPEPPRKISDSEAIQRWIEGIVSLTDRMKQAEAWLTCGSSASVGGSSTSRMRSSSNSRVAASTPQLNQTGELKAAFCVTRMCRSSWAKVSASSSSRKWPPFNPWWRMVSTTRSITSRRLVSRRGSSMP